MLFLYDSERFTISKSFKDPNLSKEIFREKKSQIGLSIIPIIIVSKI